MFFIGQSKNCASLAPPVCKFKTDLRYSKPPFDVANDSRTKYSVMEEQMICIHLSELPK